MEKAKEQSGYLVADPPDDAETQFPSGSDPPSAEEEIPEPPTEEGANRKVWIDTLGRAYPIDDYGNIVRKTSKPFGAPHGNLE